MLISLRLFGPNKTQFFNSSVTQWGLILGSITARGNVVVPVYIQHSAARASIRDATVKTKNHDNKKKNNDMNKKKSDNKHYEANKTFCAEAQETQQMTKLTSSKRYLWLSCPHHVPFEVT